MKWHRFNMPDDTPKDAGVDWECWRWTDVMPGDVVQSRGTLAWRREDFPHRNEEHVKFLRLAGAPILVLSRIPGIPNEDPSLGTDFVTFVCLSRHGIIVVLGDLNFAREKNG